jgi:hypothetical protein
VQIVIDIWKFIPLGGIPIGIILVSTENFGNFEVNLVTLFKLLVFLSMGYTKVATVTFFLIINIQANCIVYDEYICG